MNNTAKMSQVRAIMMSVFKRMSEAGATLPLFVADDFQKVAQLLEIHATMVPSDARAKQGKMTLLDADPAMLACREDMIAVMRRHKAVGGRQMLALTSYVVGQLVAAQDQRTLSAGEALQIISRNVEQGNKDAIAEVKSADGQKH